MLMPLFHLMVVVVNSFTLWYDQNHVEFPFSKPIMEQKLPFKNRILFLTMWCLLLQTIYFTISLINDVFGSSAHSPKKPPFIRKIKDTVFSLAFPIALYVFLTFWGIYAIDKELILPEKVQKVMPSWCNHVMHTLIFPNIIFELILSPRSYPSRKVGVSLIIAFTSTYLAYLCLAYSKTGTFVYPVLDVMPWSLRIVFFALSIGFGIFMYLVGEKIDSYYVIVSKGKSKIR